MVLLTAKVVAIIFALATTAFLVSTVVLAIEKANLEDDLQDALDKLDQMTTTTTTAIPNITGSTDSTTASSTSSDGTASTPGSPSDTSLSTPGNGETTVSTGSTGSTDSTVSTGTSSSTQISSTSTTLSPAWPTASTTVNPNYPTLPTGLPNPAEIVYRLPAHLKAIKYRLWIYPDLVQRTCTGTTSIQFQAEEVTNLIVLHAKDLEIESISILNMMARMRIAIEKYYTDDTRQLLIIELKELLSTNKAYTLSISYTCQLDGLSGAYASSYTDDDGSQKWIATSKFEPTYARLAFPCFDEPSLKAQFTITVVRPTEGGYHALSNMDVQSEEIVGNLTEVTFTETVPMSTYLVSFIVSDFAHKAKVISGVLTNAKDFELRVFATPAQVEKVQYALDTAAAITEHYIEYFNVVYPLPKLDMAAIPDFVSGAMENWGLVTYRETALLYDEATSSSANKQRVATVIAHELAHMWFGNLVTMNWWNDLWLNEGFASYIEYKGVNKVHEDWDMLSQFLIAELHDVLKLDGTLASHPIVQTVESPDQITEIFDTITYSKGASLVRMLEDLVTEEIFRIATTRYLSRHIYSTATTDDYLTAIEEENLDFDVKLIMQTWTEQMGLPVVEVTKSGNSYTLTQKRFLANPDDYSVATEVSQFNYHWSIPITYITSADSTVQRTIFNYNDSELTVTVPSEVEWIKFNKDQVGYYRVNYPAEQWQALISIIKTERGTFSNSDRAHLLNDAFSLAAASQLDYSLALDLSTYLENERDYVPWVVGSENLKSLRNLVYYTDIFNDFATYARNLLTPVVNSVTFEVGVDHLQNRLRATVLNTACSVGHEEALEEAAKRFNEWLVTPSVRPNPDIREVVYYYGLQQVSSESVWNQVWQLFLKEEDAQEKVKLMHALSAVQVPWILNRYIILAWDEKNVRGQDYFTCLTYISQNPIGQSLVWDYVRENWQLLVDRFGLNDRTLGRLIPSITSRFATQTKLEEMESFFAKYPEAGAGTAARKQAIETVKINIKWLQQNKAQVGEWLAQQSSTEQVANKRLN